MTPNQEKLIKLLRDMFQFDQSDLNFDIYRIMNYQRDEIDNYLTELLLPQITKGLSRLSDIAKKREMKRLDQQIECTKAIDVDEESKKPLLEKLEAKKRALTRRSIVDIEGDVHNHLINFFSRYYDEADLISQRRYKDGAYVIPYVGEEVKRHWANADQYYVKTSEYYKDYLIKSNGKAVHFKIVEAETEKYNNKSKGKRYFQLFTDKPYEIIEEELFIYFEYKAGDKSKQEEYNKQVIEILSIEFIKYPQFQNLIAVSEGKDVKCELDKQLYIYTSKNTFDYFIHKDLHKFLTIELNFYIKNEVKCLHDISIDDMGKTKEYIVKTKVIRNVAGKIIEFILQLEDYQNKLSLRRNSL